MAIPLRVLILEDRPADAELMVHQLRRAGFDPGWRRVDTEGDFLCHLTADLDLILADYSLPSFDALRALHLLQERELDIPFIVVTGSFEEVALECMKQGAADYLLKDRLARLGHAVVQALEQKRLHDEKARAAAALRASEERYRAVSELTSDYAYALRVEVGGTFGVEWVTDAFVRIAGFRPEELDWRRGWPSLVHPDDIPIAGQRTDRLLRGQPDVSEYRIVTRAGETRWLSDHSRPVLDAAQGRVVRIYGAAQDITQHKQAEEAEKALAQMKDDFVASVSHGLRTPLMSIRGFVDLLRKGKVNEPAIQQEFLARVAQDVDRLTALVNDLLDISRLEAGRLPLNLEAVDLNTLVAETLQSLEGLAREKQIAMSYAAPDAPLIVEADRRRLQQVLVNLIGNAIKFSPAGRSVLVTGQEANKQVTIKVIDQGPGIPAEALPRLFDKFYQADSLAKHAGQGTGLGLYLSEELIEAHGGRIGLESQVGRGSTFFFTLPANTHAGAPETLFLPNDREVTLP
jgi:PAS domain S-box-containing protein